MFVVRAKRTYGALIAGLGAMLFLPFVVLRESVPPVAYGFLIAGTAGTLVGLVVMLRPPRVLTADSKGVTSYSRFFFGRPDRYCPWTDVDSVHGERRELAGPDGPAEAHLLLFRLSAAARVQHSLGELSGLTSAQIPELDDPNTMIWVLTTPAIAVADIGRQLSAFVKTGPAR